MFPACLCNLSTTPIQKNVGLDSRADLDWGRANGPEPMPPSSRGLSAENSFGCSSLRHVVLKKQKRVALKLKDGPCSRVTCSVQVIHLVHRFPNTLTVLPKYGNRQDMLPASHIRANMVKDSIYLG
jgi:hypothetical protein